MSRPAGNTAVPVSIQVSGLAPATAYHFRVVAQNELGITTGTDQALTTAAAPVGGGGGGGAAPDLELTATADRSAVTAGDTVLYRARVRLENAGAAAGVSEATLTGVLPPDAELVSTKVNRGGGCSGRATVVCPLSFISGEIVGEVELLVRLHRLGSAIAALSVRALEPDPDPGNNFVSVVVSVDGPTASSVRDSPPRIVLRQPATARGRKAVLRGALATMRAEVSVNEAVRLRLRVVDPRTGRTVRLARGSRVGARALDTRAAFVETRRAGAGTVRAAAVLERASVVRGRRYLLELVAIDARGQTARLRIPFTV